MARDRKLAVRLGIVAVVVAVVAVVAVAATGGDDEGGGGEGGDLVAAPSATPHQVADGRWEWSIDGGLVEVSEWPRDQEPDDDQVAAALALTSATRDALRDLVTEEQAEAAGYVVRDEEISHETGSVHLINPDLLDDGKVLDPTAPEALVLDVATGVVYGGMFIAPLGEHGPQVSPAAPWHAHHFEKSVCFYDSGATLVDDPAIATLPPCGPDRTAGHTSPEMLHVWLVANPLGGFDSEMGVVGNPGDLPRIP